MDPQACATVFGEPVGKVCERAVQLGWNAAAGAGLLASLSGVIAGFIFAAIVMVLAPQSEHRHGLRRRISVDDSLPVLIGAFLSLLVASLLLVQTASQVHPLRIGPAASLAMAVFAAGAVQTFVAIAWMFLVSPRTHRAFGSVTLVVRFVMFASGVLLHTTVWKGQSTISGHSWGPGATAVGVAVLAGPVLLARAVSGRRCMIERFNGRFQAFTTRCSVTFLAVCVVAMVYVLDRRSPTPADAYPRPLAWGILLAVGLLFALYDMNLPPLRDAPAEGTEAVEPQLVGVAAGA